MVMIWERLGHMNHFGNAMGRLHDDIELIWVIILPNFKPWNMYGKKILMPSVVWENYGGKIPKVVLYKRAICFLNLNYGYDMECPY